MKDPLRNRASKQWKLLRRERSSKNRRAANTFLRKWPGRMTNDVPSASTVFEEENNINSISKTDESLLLIESGKPDMKVNEESENISAANEGIDCWDIDDIEDFLTLPNDEVNNEDSTMYEGLALIDLDAEYLGICEPSSTMDVSCDDTIDTGHPLDIEDDGPVSVTMEDTESMMEQNEGRQREKDDDESTQSENNSYEEEEVTYKSRTEKQKKNGGRKTKKHPKNAAEKMSDAEKKAQPLLMKMLQELCGGEYHVRVSRDALRKRAMNKDFTVRITDRAVLDTILKSTVGIVMNEKGDKFMRGYKENKRAMEFWIEGPNGEGSNTRMIEDYANIKEENIKLKEDNLMIKEKNEMLKEKLEMVRKIQHEEEEKFKNVEKTNKDLENQLRECKRLFTKLNRIATNLVGYC